MLSFDLQLFGGVKKIFGGGSSSKAAATQSAPAATQSAPGSITVSTTDAETENSRKKIRRRVMDKGATNQTGGALGALSSGAADIAKRLLGE